MDGPAPIRPQFVVDEASLCAEIRRIRELEGELGFKKMYSKISDKWPLARTAQVKKCMKDMGMLRAGPTQKQAPPTGSWLGKRAATNDDDDEDEREGPEETQREEVAEVQEQPPPPESKKAKRAAQEQQLLANALNPMPCYPPVDPGAVTQVYPPTPPAMPTYPPAAPFSAVPGVHSMYAGGFNPYPNPALPALTTPSLFPFGNSSLFRPPTWSTLTPQTPSTPLPPPPPLPSNGVLPNNTLPTLSPYVNIRPPLPALSAVVPPPPGPPPFSARPLVSSFPLQQPQLQQVHIQQLQLQMRPPLPLAPARGPTVLSPGFPLRGPPVGTISR